ncbi:hypothetical protein KUCAC02_014709 [Chaenocephalus aceratus]|uniref:Uncharacterized protein n=1 Tax=Chaenocephalus aceratus TaxID=36190 RepID=A0ACB9WEN1_CHAAC|nr:hypothetical protein KUCAC02_014709 [Chaenocephalus aceratus]
MVGPYRILTIEGEIADIGAEKGEKTMQINIDHLSHYVTPEERIPAKLKKVLDTSHLAGPLTSTSTPTSSTSSKSMAPSTDCQARGASSDEETLIRDIWAGRRKETLWAKYGPYKVYSENRLVLAPGKELEGEIVNAYLSWIGAKTGQGTHKGGIRKLDLSKHEVATRAVCDGHTGHSLSCI